MFKIKALVLGGILNVASLFFLISAAALISLKMGIFEDGTYLWLGLIIFSSASFISGIAAGKIAGEKVLLHGLAVGGINMLTALVLFLILASDSFTVFFARVLLIVAFSVSGSLIALFTEKKSQYL